MSTSEFGKARVKGVRRLVGRTSVNVRTFMAFPYRVSLDASTTSTAPQPIRYVGLNTAPCGHGLYGDPWVSDCIDRVVHAGNAVHPMSLSTTRATASSHYLYPAVVAVTESYRPILAQHFDSFKLRLDIVPVLEAAHEELNLVAFLRSQGYDIDALNEEEELRADFNRVLAQVMTAWSSECEQVNRAFCDLQQRTSAVLRDQACARPVLESEEPLRLALLQRKFSILKAQLRQRLTSELIEYARMNWLTDKNVACEKRRKPLKRALEQNSVFVLQRWWDQHTDDPYPTEEEKAVLASAGNLTLVQVNNWFSNRRVRIKKRTRRVEAHMTIPNDKKIKDHGGSNGLGNGRSTEKHSLKTDGDGNDGASLSAVNSAILPLRSPSPFNVVDQ